MPSSEPEMNQVSFQPKRGLSEFGYPDHYAVLGIAVDASSSEIRKRYMTLARMLHPDSCKSSDKQLASQVLSKMVNPAYQVLSQGKEHTDYNLLLKLVGQRANLEIDTIRLSSEAAQALLRASDYEALYRQSLQKLASQQYTQLDQPLEATELISELNLAFLLRRETAPTGPQKVTEPPQAPPESINSEASMMSQVREPAATQPFAAQATTTATDSYVSQYLRRAQELADKKLYTAATQELRDALRLDPQNLRCHALMGSVYLKQNQPKMAKGHLTQAIKLNPSDAEARQGMAELQKVEAQLAKSAQSGSKATQSGAKATQTDAKPAGRKGLFGLFGGKK